MTTTQALRYERRRRREIERQRKLRETLLAILTILYILAAFTFAGTMDYYDDQRELAYWAERGVTVGRW